MCGIESMISGYQYQLSTKSSTANTDITHRLLLQHSNRSDYCRETIVPVMLIQNKNNNTKS